MTLLAALRIIIIDNQVFSWDAVLKIIEDSRVGCIYQTSAFTIIYRFEEVSEKERSRHTFTDVPVTSTPSSAL